MGKNSKPGSTPIPDEDENEPDPQQRWDEMTQSGETTDRLGVENPEQMLAEKVEKARRKTGTRKK